MNPEKEPRVEEAQEVYLILKRDYRISRNIRAQWYLNNLNKTFQVKNKSIEDCTSEIDIISVTPSIHGCNSDVSYLLTPSTDVVFLFHQYRLIFCLDLSPSTAAVDIQHGEILYNEVLPALAKCLTGLTQPFHIPGSKVLFQPQIFVTVVAHMPFLNSKARQILVQGWQVSAENLNVFMEYIEKQLMAIETSVVESTKLANKELNDARMAESSIGKPDVSDNTFDGNKDSSIKNVLNSATVTQSSMMMMTPATHDCNLVNMLRYGIFAVQLLPENSCAGIIIITDGMLGLPDVSLIDSLLTQLRNSSVSCSFLQVGSQYHPYSCYGLIPNTDLMQFIAKATLGTHIHVPLNIDVGDNTVNVFHKMSILWSFQRKLAEPNDREPKASDKEWSVRNHGFYSNVDMSVLRKKQSENTLEAPLQNILSCRLREGYTIKDVTFVGDNQIEVKLVFPWRPTVNIEYLLKSVWPLNYSYMTCHYEITIEGNYDFLHDVTCLVKKPVTSPFRANVVKKYWQTLQSISQTDQLLARLCSFASNPVNYTVPDSNKNGVPLFFVPPNNSNTPVPCCSDNTHSAYSVFSNFWKPMCMLDISIWQKWMHTHSIGILLEHDMQLPKYLHQPNSTGRYNLVQCRQAIMSVHRFLRDWSSFVLIENHSYIKLIFREKDKPPVSFYIIRVTTKAPCMVIRLAFLGGMSGFERNKVVQDLKDKILSLNFPQRAMSKEPSMPKSTQLRMSHRSGDGSTMVRDKIYRSPLQRAWSEINCCVLMHKPVEKMIVRYERIPVDFKSPVHMMELDDNRRTNSMNTSSSMAVAGGNKMMSMLGTRTGMLTVLSRYLYHHRWIWSLQNASHSQITLQAASRILSTLTKLRLQEGYHFGHSYAGVINMVLELEVSAEKSVASALSHMTDDKIYLVLQYVIFPPHSTTSSIRDSQSDDDGDDMDAVEADGELQIVTECWVEPQFGFVTNSTPERKYLEGLTYQQIPSAHGDDEDAADSTNLPKIHGVMIANRLQLINILFDLILMAQKPKLVHILPMDFDCISSIVTLEHLNLMCKEEGSTSQLPRETVQPLINVNHTTNDVNSTIQYVPFCFDLLSLLPKCQQAELLFSSYIQDLCEKRDSVDLLPNQVLFEQLIRSFSDIHDTEIDLVEAECLKFADHVLSRQRFCRYAVPFLPYSTVENPPIHGNIRNPIKEDSGDDVPRWRCFVKGVSSTHVLLTFMPASYEDLAKLILPRGPTIHVPSKAVRYKNASHFECISESNVSQTDADRVDENANDDSNVTVDSSVDVITDHLNQDGTQDASSEKFFRVNDTIVEGEHVRAPRHKFSRQCEIDRDDGLDRMLRTGSITLPVYVYDCPLGGLIDHALYRIDGPKFRDIYHDFTHKMDDDSEFLHRESELHTNDFENGPNYANIAQESPEPKSEDSDYPVDKNRLKQHCNIIHVVFSKCFVDGVYSSLRSNLAVDSADVTAIVDGICEESLIEIDVTDFLKSVCAHVRDFLGTTNKDSRENSERSRSHDGKDGNAEDANVNDNHKTRFFLSLLRKHQPCQTLQQLHLEIKENFNKIIGENFAPIPTNLDYLYYRQSYDDNTDNVSEQEADNDANGPEMELNDDESDDDPDTAAKSVEFSENVQEFGTRNSSVASSQWSMTSNMNSCNASSAKDSSAVISSPNCQQPSIPSLFMSMTCSVRSHGNLTVRTVPTCLNEISSCFDDSLVDVDLDEVKVTLDILCLTLSSDVESGYLQQSSRIRRTTSFCSSSSPAQDLPENPDGVVEDSLNGSIFPNSADPISHLSTVQQHAVKSIISQVNWMLMDEVASSALDTYPITTEILEKVSKHIDGTKHVPTCITEEVPLKFVCGTKTSLDKFIDKFKRLSVPSYHLNQEGDYYYLVKDNKSEDSGKRRRSSSLVPPLFVSDPPPLNLHSDDGTELRSITAANDAPPIAEGFVKIRKPSVDVLGDSPPIKKEDIFSNVTERNLLRRRTTDDSDDDSDDEASKDIGKQTLKGKKLRASRERETSAFVSGISKPITELEGHPIGTSSPKKSSDRSSSTRSQIRTVTTFTDARNSASQLKILKLAPDVNDDSICASFSPPHNIKTTMSTLWQSKQVSTGSRYCSNTEDGYDGDGSDSEIENQWLSIFDRHRPVLPNFWLIMKVSNNSVHTYFHTRKTSDIADKLSDYIHVQQQVVTIIKNICKLVNQTLLLQSLHERRMCQKLLVPETNDDIWKQGASSATLGHHLQDSQEYEADAEYTGGNYLEATMKFKPGAFACDVVWETYFVLHHRLITGHAHGGMSRGIQALRTLLNSISVNNRTNMFVYREPSGSVFYLRLHELTQYVPTSSGSIMANPWDQPYSNASKTDDDNSIIGSRSSSILSLNTKKERLDNQDADIESEFRPRTSSGASEKDKSQDTVSLNSKSSSVAKKALPAIRLSVHGITEAGSEIKEILIKGLQNKLDEAVLDVICSTLERNPQCKLTPEDVQFIQKCNEPPSQVVQFTIHEQASSYLHAINYYLRQNLRQFLSHQKYTDQRPETHFHGYSNGCTDFTTCDEDVFLYNRQTTSGTSGNKGIACVVLSILDGQGNTVNDYNKSLKPPIMGYMDINDRLDFDSITSTSIYCPENRVHQIFSEPLSLVRLQIWEKGQIGIDSLTLKFLTAVRHSLWDLMMEYKFQTAPLCTISDETKVSPHLVCTSEPSTPLKKARADSLTHCLDTSGRSLLQHSLVQMQQNELTTSVPEMKFLNEDVKVNRKRISPHGTKQKKVLAIDLESANLRTEEELLRCKCEQGEVGKLMPILYTLLKDYMMYGKSIAVPSIKTTSCKLSSRYSIPLFIKELQSLVSHLMSDSCVRVFKKVVAGDNHQHSYRPLASVWTAEVTQDVNDGSERCHVDTSVKPGQTTDYILIARNVHHWRKCLGNHLQSLIASNTSSSRSTHNSGNANGSSSHASVRRQQKFSSLLAYDVDNRRISSLIERFNVIGYDGRSMSADSGKALSSNEGNLLQGLASANATTHISNLSINSMDSDKSILIPRQRFLMVLANDKEVSLLLYNWPEDLVNSLFKRVSRLSMWHAARSRLLDSIVLQKMGLFHNEPYFRQDTNQENPFMRGQVDLLVRHGIPTSKELTARMSGGSAAYGIRRNQSQYQQVSSGFRDTFRNAKPNQPLHKTLLAKYRDPLIRHGTQMIDIKKADQREIDKKLCAMWRSRGSSYDQPITDEMMKTFKQKSRMFHYCLSPFLFLQNWRLQLGTTRDHTVPVLKKTSSRQRNESGISIKSGKRLSMTTIPEPPKPKQSKSNEEWHVGLCSSLLQEYAQYLQNLGGFVLIKTQSVTNKSSQQAQNANENASETALDDFKMFPKFYLVKSALGGLIGVEIGYSEPFFSCRFYGLNCIFLQGRSSMTLNSQLTLAFVEECDKLKVLMHLHSFTFDFHLFTIYAFVSGRQLIFRQGYHVISLLDDLAKYYEKAPMFARNLIYADSVIVQDMSTPASTLYQYILNHNKLYAMKVLRMDSAFPDISLADEYALIELSTHRILYNDANDQHQSEVFDAALMVTHDISCENKTDDRLQSDISANTHCLHLKYYIILTSRKGLYPKLTLEEKSGTFRFVHTSNRQRKSIIEPPNLTEMLFQDRDTVDNLNDLEAKISKHDDENKVNIKSPGSMCKEAVNYLSYFSCEETLMYNVLEEQAKKARSRLESIVSQAMVHCRRDMLWDQLLVGVGKRRREDFKDLPCLTFNDFTELLDLVLSVSLDKIDPNLTTFFNMPTTWYLSLTKVLTSKYGDDCRVFTSSDGVVQHVVVLNPKCLDTFILMSINQQSNKVELCQTYREEVNDDEDDGVPSQRSSVQSLIEGFIGSCCYHLWCGLL